MKTSTLSIVASALLASAGLTATAMAAEPQEQFPQVIFESGNSLLAKCSKDYGECMTYVSAVSDTMQDIASFFPGAKVCITAAVTKGQLTDVVLKYLTDNPAKRHFSASSEVGIALWNAFPCPQQTAKAGS